MSLFRGTVIDRQNLHHPAWTSSKIIMNTWLKKGSNHD